ncbi:hypothetical protein [Kitasatospora phosalacinea]|uniref:PASTA domain-containing protein n=1 Tax=Kitasatospora phosalacinea TaxID=2065 RepID=A0ABW6GKF7_9ACTN
MRRTAIAVGLLLAAATTACDPTPVATNPTAPAGAVPPATASAGGTAPSSGGEAKAAALPDFTGMGLQAAQDEAQAAGFYRLQSHDALGRSRSQLSDRNWKVCSQAPAAGQQPTDTTVDMAAVKLDEQCPATDQGGSTPQVGSAMPDVKGKSAAAVRDMLPKNTSFSVKDVAQSRMVVVESNWQVCSQDPAAGAALNGQPVALGVVKFGETCP